MRSITKKFIKTGAAAVIALGVLTACTKTAEKTDDTEPRTAEDADQAGNSEVAAEELPVFKDVNDREEPKTEEEDAQASAGEETDALHYINEGRDLYGDIWEVGENQFTVIEIYREETEEGGGIMAAPADGTDEQEEAQKITVAYDENTKFVKQKIWDGGAGHEEKEATAADLKKGLTAEMNGNYEGDVFHATEILIVEVSLE